MGFLGICCSQTLDAVVPSDIPAHNMRNVTGSNQHAAHGFFYIGWNGDNR